MSVMCLEDLLSMIHWFELLLLKCTHGLKSRLVPSGMGKFAISPVARYRYQHQHRQVSRRPPRGRMGDAILPAPPWGHGGLRKLEESGGAQSRQRWLEKVARRFGGQRGGSAMVEERAMRAWGERSHDNEIKNLGF